MSGADEILVSVEEGIKTITINLPKKRNPLDPSNALRMAEEVERCREEGVRVIVLTGAGGAFCAGADLTGDLLQKALGGEMVPEGDLDEMVCETYHRLSRAIYEAPMPVIASVDGVAVGFGCSLALNADITLASTRARFIEVFINLALIPDGGSTYILPKVVGLKKALEMVMTGEPVPAEEALRLNMVNRVYPPEELEEQTRSWARRLAEGPVRSMALARRTILEGYPLGWGEALELESRRQARLMTRPDFINAVKAFLEKRKPTFS